jgi:hypothetical protein
VNGGGVGYSIKYYIIINYNGRDRPNRTIKDIHDRAVSLHGKLPTFPKKTLVLWEHAP